MSFVSYRLSILNYQLLIINYQYVWQLDLLLGDIVMAIALQRCWAIAKFCNKFAGEEKDRLF
ncbi:hypothetical protein [Spirulina sp. 06S082]|uniref:hypothetical protein n=1 Tax=Spirulina sp. 06S082 TaxID=3110248 RepID=UPI002B1FE7B8|nr:hypothetical protein [Spirulina sp. 06S082]MEA5470508.1 hypothetical protein [Spirulina sp. 06S082]